MISTRQNKLDIKYTMEKRLGRIASVAKRFMFSARKTTLHISPFVRKEISDSYQIFLLRSHLYFLRFVNFSKMVFDASKKTIVDVSPEAKEELTRQIKRHNLQEEKVMLIEGCQTVKKQIEEIEVKERAKTIFEVCKRLFIRK